MGDQGTGAAAVEPVETGNQKKPEADPEGRSRKSQKEFTLSELRALQILAQQIQSRRELGANHTN